MISLVLLARCAADQFTKKIRMVKKWHLPHPLTFNGSFRSYHLGLGLDLGLGLGPALGKIARPEQSISGKFRNIGRFFSTSQLTKYFEKCRWVCTSQKRGWRSNVPEENTPEDTKMFSIEM